MFHEAFLCAHCILNSNTTSSNHCKYLLYEVPISNLAEAVTSDETPNDNVQSFRLLLAWYSLATHCRLIFSPEKAVPCVWYQWHRRCIRWMVIKLRRCPPATWEIQLASVGACHTADALSTYLKHSIIIRETFKRDTGSKHTERFDIRRARGADKELR